MTNTNTSTLQHSNTPTHPRIYLSPPHMGGEEIRFIQEAFETNWISPAGPNIDHFESELAAYCGAPHCAAVSSGTAAIHLALIILGVKSGDEVLCSTFTFSGSCNPIRYLDASPFFIDSESESWNMDPQLFEDAIKDRIKAGRKPKAAIAVHLYGMPARIREIMDIARHYGIPVIEDAAEALGASYEGQKLGSFGDIGIFSFNGNKIITTSGGGALVSANKKWIEEARYLATQARDPAPHYQHSRVGYNYRLSNICAGIGRGQLKVLDERVRRRREIFDYYQKELGTLRAVTFQPAPVGAYSNRWLTCLLVDPSKGNGTAREDIRLALAKESIESRPLWKPMHLQPVFRNFPSFGGGVSEHLFDQGLCLPSGSNLDDGELSGITRIVRSVLER